MQPILQLLSLPVLAQARPALRSPGDEPPDRRPRKRWDGRSRRGARTSSSMSAAIRSKIRTTRAWSKTAMRRRLTHPSSPKGPAVAEPQAGLRQRWRRRAGWWPTPQRGHRSVELAAVDAGHDEPLLVLHPGSFQFGRGQGPVQHPVVAYRRAGRHDAQEVAGSRVRTSRRRRLGARRRTRRCRARDEAVAVGTYLLRRRMGPQATRRTAGRLRRRRRRPAAAHTSARAGRPFFPPPDLRRIFGERDRPVRHGGSGGGALQPNLNVVRPHPPSGFLPPRRQEVP